MKLSKLEGNEANLRQLRERIQSEEKKSLQSDNSYSLDDFSGDDDNKVLIDTGVRRPLGDKTDAPRVASSG